MELPYSSKENIFDSSLWPENVLVNKFFFPKSNKNPNKTGSLNVHYIKMENMFLGNPAFSETEIEARAELSQATLSSLKPRPASDEISFCFANVQCLRV